MNSNRYRHFVLKMAPAREEDLSVADGVSCGNGGDFACIECGVPTTSLYKKYSATVLKLNVCSNCNKIMDKYIEYDQSIVYMDLVLQKLGAYRHVLIHGNSQSFWKFGFVCLLCDAYTRWTQLSCHDLHSCTNVEWDFYIMCALAIFEVGIKVAIICLATLMLERLSKMRVHWRKLSCGLLIANHGQLFEIPALVWDQRHSWISFVLSLYVYFSHIQAYRASCSATTVTTCVVIVASGLLASHLFVWAVTPASLDLLRGTA